MPSNQNHKYWTRERVKNGLRRFVRDYFAGNELNLPPRPFNYRDAIPAEDRRRARRMRLYPSDHVVLRFYESFVEAWLDLGYTVKQTTIEFWTRDEIVRGLKLFFKDFGYCPTDYRAYHEKARFQNKFRRDGTPSATGAYNKYPSVPTILKYFRSMRNAWTSAGFAVDQRMEPWSPAEDEFILESAGILPRAEVAELLKRTEPAVKRRLYDLGRVNSKNRWGITVTAACDLLGIGRHALNKYLDYGIIPYFRGHKYFYLNPADLPKIQEFDWSILDEKSELARKIKRALIERLLLIIKYGAGWRKHEIYKFHKTKEPHVFRVIKARSFKNIYTLPKPPAELQEGDKIKMKRRFRMIAGGRSGIIRKVFYTTRQLKNSDREIIGLWAASVEFPKMKRFTSLRPETVFYTIPFDYLEKIEEKPVRSKNIASTGKAVKKIHFEKDGLAVCRQNSKTDRFKLEISTDKNAVTCQTCLDILDGKIFLCRFGSKDELPEKAYCLKCESEKPIAEMIVVFLRKENLYRIRPRCKSCHNENERGHRREWKRKYLRNWREDNAAVNESYWKNNSRVREQSRLRANKLWSEKREALLIQGRMNRHRQNISLKEAEGLLKKYGRCYPTPQGLTPDGLRECEKIRSRFRLRHEKPPSPFNIRRMVYEDDNGSYAFVIRPEDQPLPYRIASENLKKWHRGKRQQNLEAVNG